MVAAAGTAAAAQATQVAAAADLAETALPAGRAGLES